MDREQISATPLNKVLHSRQPFSAVSGYAKFNTSFSRLIQETSNCKSQVGRIAIRYYRALRNGTISDYQRTR
jgi:hypothetical protein